MPTKKNKKTKVQIQKQASIYETIERSVSISFFIEQQQQKKEARVHFSLFNLFSFVLQLITESCIKVKRID